MVYQVVSRGQGEKTTNHLMFDLLLMVFGMLLNNTYKVNYVGQMVEKITPDFLFQR